MRRRTAPAPTTPNKRRTSEGKEIVGFAVPRNTVADPLSGETIGPPTGVTPGEANAFAAEAGKKQRKRAAAGGLMVPGIQIGRPGPSGYSRRRALLPGYGA